MSKKKKHNIAIVSFYGYVLVVLWITIFSRHSPTGKKYADASILGVCSIFPQHELAYST